MLPGNVLLSRSRDQLTLWMKANLTGLERLRAKLPGGWRAADKTGSNGEYTSNDIAVLWPVGKPPIIVAPISRNAPALRANAQQCSRRSANLWPNHSLSGNRHRPVNSASYSMSE